MTRSTHTYATLAVSAAAHDEVSRLLREAGHDHVFMGDGAIDMHGIGLVREDSSAAAQEPATAGVVEKLARFDHHPDPSTDFCIEVEALQGWSIDMRAGRRSQWPFWGRLSRLLRFIKSPEFAELDEIAQRAKPIVLGLEQSVQERLPGYATLTPVAPKTPDAAIGGSVGDGGLREETEKWSVASGFPHTTESSAAWMDSAAMFSRNADFYRGIVVQIGEMFGDAAKTSDDGSLQDSVLALKVPGLVAAALAQLAPVGEDETGVREALAWYGEQARLARLIHSEGDSGRHALSDDGGKRAAAALASQPPKAETPAGVGEALAPLKAYEAHLAEKGDKFLESGFRAFRAGMRFAALSTAPAARPGDEVFPVGTPVEKITGEYDFPGTVVAAFDKLGGQRRYVVEDDRRSLHIFSAANLRVRLAAAPAADGGRT